MYSFMETRSLRPESLTPTLNYASEKRSTSLYITNARLDLFISTYLKLPFSVSLPAFGYSCDYTGTAASFKPFYKFLHSDLTCIDSFNGISET